MGCLGSNTVNDVKKALKGDKYRIVFMVGADTSPLETLAKKASEEFRHTLINTNDLGQGKVSNRLLSAVVQDITNELKGSAFVSSATLVKAIGLMLNTAKDKRVLIEGFPRSQEDLDAWNKAQGEDCDTACFIYVEVSDDKVKEGANDEIALKKCDYFINTTKPFCENMSSLGNKYAKIDGSKTEDEAFTDVKNTFVDKKLF